MKNKMVNRVIKFIIYNYYLIIKSRWMDIMDTKKMTKYDNLIVELQNEIYSLQGQLSIVKLVDNRFIDGLVQSKYDEITRLIDNSVLL